MTAIDSLQADQLGLAIAYDAYGTSGSHWRARTYGSPNSSARHRCVQTARPVF